MGIRISLCYQSVAFYYPIITQFGTPAEHLLFINNPTLKPVWLMGVGYSGADSSQTLLTSGWPSRAHVIPDLALVEEGTLSFFSYSILGCYIYLFTFHVLYYTYGPSGRIPTCIAPIIYWPILDPYEGIHRRMH